MIPRDVLYERRLLCVTPPMLMIIVHDGKDFFYHIKFEKNYNKIDLFYGSGIVVVEEGRGGIAFKIFLLKKNSNDICIHDYHHV